MQSYYNCWLLFVLTAGCAVPIIGYGYQGSTQNQNSKIQQSSNSLGPQRIEDFIFSKHLLSVDRATNWDYNCTDCWKESYPSCGSGLQSPIVIQRDYMSDQPLQFHNYDYVMRNLQISNNGHSIEIEIPTNLPENSRPAISGGRRTNRYETVSIHFHWAPTDECGSEHTIGFTCFGLEMHMVHLNEKYDNADEALNHADGLSVLAVMIDVSKSKASSSGLQTIFNKIQDVSQYRASSTIAELSLSSLLENMNLENFYSYDGSLTTPPCAEVVAWYVFGDRLYLDQREATKLSLVSDQNSGHLIRNHRPIQNK